MRNDARDDVDDLPILTAEARDEFAAPAAALKPAPRRNGALWVLIVALLIALAGLAWWSFQQIKLMERSLIATQESFAQISEDTEGRIRDISGRVVKTESSLSSGSEALSQQVRKQQEQIAALLEKQREASTRLEAQDKQLKQINEQLTAEKAAAGEQEKLVKTLQGRLDQLSKAQEELAKLSTRVTALNSDITALKRSSGASADIKRLESDLLLLRTELESAGGQSKGGLSVSDFDAFRAQINRNITALQGQVAELQKSRR